MTGEDTVAVLLRALPPDLLDNLLKRMTGDKAQKIRNRIENLKRRTPAGDRLDGALEAFIKLKAERKQALEAAEKAKNDYRMGKGKSDSTKPKIKPPIEKLNISEEVEVPIAIHHLRDIPPDLLVRVLIDEQTSTLAMVLSVVDAQVATEVMKKLPPERRPELAIRLAQPMTSNPELTELLAQAVVQKAIKLATAAPEPTGDDRIQNLATMLRGLKREERMNIIDALNASDPTTCNKVRDKLYLFEDILRIEDRALQLVLVELDSPTLATSLSGTDEKIKAKIVKNMSSRAQSMLNEELGLLGSVPPAKATQAQAKIIAVIRRFEEEGKLTIEV